MNKEQIASAWALVNAATKGPWQQTGETGPDAKYVGTFYKVCGDDAYVSFVSAWKQNVTEEAEAVANAAFIAASRELVPQLLTEIEAERAKVARVVELLIEASTDLTAYVNAEYPSVDCAKYPAIERRRYRDLELVRRIEAATLTSIKEAPHE